MDMHSWKKVLLQWINECSFTERCYYNIEQSDIDTFYQKFSLKHQKTATEQFKHLGNFLKEFYPNFELNFDDENCLSSADYIYVYSLLLHFCCVKHPQTVFHEICQRLPEQAQQCIASFFKELVDATEPITKETLRHAIAEMAKQLTPPRLNDSYSVSSTRTSVGGQTSASYSHCVAGESPLKTPQRNASLQRISPSTPKSFLLEERTRELFGLRAQLETERYEKLLFEAQIKQNEEKIQKLNNDHKSLLQQIQNLKNDIFLNNSSEDSTDIDDKEYQIKQGLLKELANKEQEISRLSDFIRCLQEKNSTIEKERNKVEKENIICKNSMEEMDLKFEELKEELEKRNAHIKLLNERKLELEQFIAETRASKDNQELNESVDCMDGSFLRNSLNTNSSQSVSSPENLGTSVIDKQLREKEHENQLLKEELRNVKLEHKRLVKHLTKLTEEYDLPLDSSSPVGSELSEPDNDMFDEAEEKDLQNNKISGEDQFNLLKYCIEKINKFRQTEKTKIKRLEQETIDLQEENQDLATKLDQLKFEIENLKSKLNIKDKLHKQLQCTKEEIEMSLKKSQTDLQNLVTQKENLYEELQALERNNKILNESIQDLKTQLELQQKECSTLLGDNEKLKENEQSLEQQLCEMKKEIVDKSLQWQEELRKVNETMMASHKQEIAEYKQRETTIKCNFEKMVVQNEDLKKDNRQVNAHLTEMKKLLIEKEKQMASLGEKLNELKEKNQNLERNIDDLMQTHQKDNVKNQTVQTDIDNQLKKLKDQLSKTSLLMESKQHECVLKQQQLKQLETKVSDIQKIFGHDSIKANIFMNIAEIEIKVKNLINTKTELTNEIKVLKEKQAESQAVIQEFNQDIKEKIKILNHTEQKLSILANKYKKCETDNENLKEELGKIRESYDAAQDELLELRKLKEETENEHNKHKQEHKATVEKLQKDIKEAQIIYQTSLERIGAELKVEKEQHNIKAMELMVIKAEHNELKKVLQEREQDLHELQADNQRIQENYERLKQYETKVAACTTENEKLRREIETCKKEVNQNALRLLEADKALSDFMELTKRQDTVRSEVETLRDTLREKEQLNTKMELEYNVQLEQQNDMLSTLREELEKLGKDKGRMAKEVEDKNQQILREQQDKLVLLDSLEKSADQLKLATKEKQQQIEALELRIHEIKFELNTITLHNTQLQGELKEREADFQQKLSELMQDLSRKSNELEAIDTDLIEIMAIAENNFNSTQEYLQNNHPVDNIFRYNEMESEKNAQKLRQLLNIVFHKQLQLLEQLNELSNEKQKALQEVNILQKGNIELQTKCNQHEKSLSELRQQLVAEEAVMEKRIYQDLQRIKEDLLNLENVNERLTNENVQIQTKLSNVEQDLVNAKQQLQAFEQESLQLNEQLRSKAIIVEKLQQEEKKLMQSLKEKQQQSEKITEKSKNLDSQLKEKTSKLQNFEKECQEWKEKANKNQQKLAFYQQSQQTQQAEHKKLQDKLKTLQSSNETMEMEINALKKEILGLKNENSKFLQQNNELEQQLHSSLNKLDEIVTSKLNAETKCEQLQSEAQQLNRDLEFVKTQQQSHQDDYNRLLKEIDSLKDDKQHLRNEINDNKITLQRANDNVSQLIQQISSIRLEKEAALEQIQLLRKQLEETGKHQNTSETKMKSIIEKSQDFERKLLASENELKNIKINFEKTEKAAAKLKLENNKLRESQEASTKRIEKLSIKLGDSQAKSAKLERDNEKLSRTLEAHTINVEALQKEKDLLQVDAKSLKERLSRAERCQEQLVAKTQTLEHQISTLQQIKQKLEATEIDNRTKINKLEKLKEVNEDKLRKLTNAFNNIENTNVKLNLEVGSLNSEVQELKAELKQAQQHQQMEELKQQLEQAQELSSEYKDINEKLKIEINDLKEHNSSLNDKLSKTSLSLEITSKKYEGLVSELEEIRAEILIIREEKSQIKLQHDNSMQKLSKFESENTQLLNERENLVKSLEQRITHLEEELMAKAKEVIDLQKEIDSLKENTENHGTLIQQNTTANLTELNELRTKLSLAEDVRKKEEKIISELRLDNQILHTKYQESKKRALDAEKSCQERIKENRLELEGKLEKMKNKMSEITATTRTVEPEKHWKKRIHSCFRYFFVIVFAQLLFILILNYFLSKNDLEVIFKSNKPAVF